MNDKSKSKQKADEEPENRRAASNDGPDETPVHADLYHDEGRRNVLEEDAPDSGGQEKGDDL